MRIPRRLAAWLRLGALLVCGFSLAAPAGVPAAAAGERFPVPDATLEVGNREQRGRLWTGQWVTPPDEDSQCSVLVMDGLPIPPGNGLEVARGHVRGEIVIDLEQRPRRLKAMGFTELNEDRFPEPPRVAIEQRLRPLREGGEVVAWRLRFSTFVEDHVYLLVWGAWVDRVCDFGRSDAGWTFHLEAR